MEKYNYSNIVKVEKNTEPQYCFVFTFISQQKKSFSGLMLD